MSKSLSSGLGIGFGFVAALFTCGCLIPLGATIAALVITSIGISTAAEDIQAQEQADTAAQAAAEQAAMEAQWEANRLEAERRAAQLQENIRANAHALFPDPFTPEPTPDTTPAADTAPAPDTPALRYPGAPPAPDPTAAEAARQQRLAEQLEHNRQLNQ